MQNIPNPAVIFAAILIAVIFIIYLILKYQGEEASFLNGAIFRNPAKLFQLAKRTENKVQKVIYFALVFSIPILSSLFVYTAYTQMSNSTSSIKCEYQEYFKNREWNGNIVNKYLDKENHAYRTISVESDDRTYKIQGQILSESNNYELIQIGDSISKIKGETIVHLYKAGGEFELKLDFDCD